MNNIRWVIQNNLIKESDYRQIQEACINLGIASENVSIVPFSEELPSFTLDSKTNIYYGSTTFMYNLYQQLKPKGLFFDETAFSMQNYMEKWGKHMLNAEAEVTTFKNFCAADHPLDSLWFIRPDADDKSFSGTVMPFAEIKEWVRSFETTGVVGLSTESKIIAGEPYNIKKEWRNYIVNGKAVTSSLYRQDFKLKKSGTDIPESMIHFVEERCKEYTPHAVFAMDIALCGEEYFIIECGCLNSVGLYDCNIHHLVKEVSHYVSENY